MSNYRSDMVRELLRTRAQADRLHRAVARVLALHEPERLERHDMGKLCKACGVPCPCPTRRALEGNG